MSERLSSLDTSFLHLEGPTTPMTISSLAIYEGTPAPAGRLKEALRNRLHLVPRFRQRIEPVAGGIHRPVWVDDPEFDMDRHVRHIRLAPPGTEQQLHELTAELLSYPLDRTRPLWEMWVIDDLADDRFAILSKTHHALWDGVTGADVHAVLLDAEPDADDPLPDPWEPTRAPSGIDLAVEAAAERIREPFRLARGAWDAIRKPRETAETVGGFVSGFADLARSSLVPAPRSPLNVPIRSGRRFETTRRPLDDVKRLKDAFGATVNDVVLTAVAGALRTWLQKRGLDPAELQVMVPVSVRGEGDGQTGNRVAMVILPLPVTEPDPLRRLDLVRQRMADEKGSGAVRAGELATELAAFAPPMAIAGLTQLQSVQRAFNLLVTNIPGPSFPLYCCGHRLLELYPQAPLASNQGLAVAVMSYDGGLGFGILADRDALWDADVFTKALEESLGELVEMGRTEGELLQREETPVADGRAAR